MHDMFDDSLRWYITYGTVITSGEVFFNDNNKCRKLKTSPVAIQIAPYGKSHAPLYAFACSLS